MQHQPAVELRLASAEDRPELLRMYAEQTRILHGFDASVVPDQVLQSDWWEKPDDLFPYNMIYRDGVPVGFCLVMGARYVAAVGQEGDYLIWEMFVDEPHRGSGVAEHAVQLPYQGTEGRNDAGFATFEFVA